MKTKLTIAITLLCLAGLWAVFLLSPQPKREIPDTPTTKTTFKEHARYREECKYIYVRMGEHTFRILREEHPYLEYNNKSIKRPPCIHEPINVTYFSFLPHYFPKYSSKERDDNRMFLALQISISYYPKERNKELYFTIMDIIKENDISLEDLPIDSGYYSIHHNGQSYFLPTDSKIKTPQGVPVVYHCTSSPIQTSLNCGTGFKWKNQLTVGIGQINTFFIPKEEWENFYNIFLDYIQNLEINYKTGE